MNADRAALGLRFYRSVTLVLALALALLGYAFHRASADLGADLSKTPAAAPAPTPSAPRPPSSAAPAPPRVRVVDVAKQLRDFDRLGEQKADETATYFTSPYGTVSLHSIAYRQRVPMHFRRLAHVAWLPVSGDIEEAWLAPGTGRVDRVVARARTGTVTDVPPYSAHEWANLSDAHVAVALEFVSAPADGRSYVAVDDDRTRVGGSPSSFDVAKALHETEQSKEPFRKRPLPMMNGKLASLSVVTSAKFEAEPYATVVWVATGKGKIVAGEEHAIQGEQLVIIAEHVPYELRADAGAPLGLVTYQPMRDEVSNILKSGKKLYSQGDEELVIRDFFQDRRDGVFLDVGANHYKDDSTTYYLEEKLGWSGIAVDGLPEYAAGYLEHRKKTRFFNYVVTDKPQGIVKFYRSTKWPVLSSTSEKTAKDEGRVFVDDEAVTELQVPSTSIDQLLREQNVSKLDFLSMDIEDHEPVALAGFDLQRYQPALVCIEAHRSVADAIVTYFHDRGYVRLDKYLPYDSLNWYFTPRAR